MLKIGTCTKPDGIWMCCLVFLTMYTLCLAWFRRKIVLARRRLFSFHSLWIWIFCVIPFNISSLVLHLVNRLLTTEKLTFCYKFLFLHLFYLFFLASVVVCLCASFWHDNSYIRLAFLLWMQESSKVLLLVLPICCMWTLPLCFWVCSR